MVVARVEKPGLAGSGGGPCEDTDFETELAGYRAAFDAVRALAAVDTARMAILGLSNGAGFAPLIAQGRPVAAYVSVNGWARTWAEHMLELERRRLTLSGRPAAEVTAAMRGFVSFYDAYLNGGMTPGEVFARRPELRGLWYDEPARQYGRPARFYHQLQALDLAAAWGRVTAPVLVVHGSHDWIMSDEDVAPILGPVPAGAARRELRTLAGFAHVLTWHPTPQDAFRGRNGVTRDDAGPLVVGWLRSRLPPAR
jgi:pimeloyl-ACP methyl ester carboxylesterase